MKRQPAPSQKTKSHHKKKMGAAKSTTYRTVPTATEPPARGLGICAESDCRANRTFKDTGYCYFHACRRDPALEAARQQKMAETKARKAAVEVVNSDDEQTATETTNTERRSKKTKRYGRYVTKKTEVRRSAFTVTPVAGGVYMGQPHTILVKAPGMRVGMPF